MAGLDKSITPFKWFLGGNKVTSYPIIYTSRLMTSSPLSLSASVVISVLSAFCISISEQTVSRLFRLDIVIVGSLRCSVEFEPPSAVRGRRRKWWMPKRVRGERRKWRSCLRHRPSRGHESRVQSSETSEIDEDDNSTLDEVAATSFPVRLEELLRPLSWPRHLCWFDQELTARILVLRPAFHRHQGELVLRLAYHTSQKNLITLILLHVSHNIDYNYFTLILLHWFHYTDFFTLIPLHRYFYTDLITLNSLHLSHYTDPLDQHYQYNLIITWIMIWSRWKTNKFSWRTSRLENVANRQYWLNLYGCRSNSIFLCSTSTAQPSHFVSFSIAVDI